LAFLEVRYEKHFIKKKELTPLTLKSVAGKLQRSNGYQKAFVCQKNIFV